MRSNGLTAQLLTVLPALSGWLLLSPVLAFSQTPFYQGKIITLLQSTQAGDTSDTMTRAIVPFLKKHIPGEPTIKFEFMPGSGERKPPTISSATCGRTVLPSAASAAVW
jgi:hypothetical protein